MERRDFLKTATAGIAAAAAGSVAFAQGQEGGRGRGGAPAAGAPPAGGGGRGAQAPIGNPPAYPRSPKAQNISFMTLNFGNWLTDVPDVQPNQYRSLSIFDIGQMVADVYDVHRIEFQSAHFMDWTPAYFAKLKASLAKSKSVATQINAEFGALAMSAATVGARAQAVALTKAMIDNAVMLGAKRVMVNQGQQMLGTTNFAEAVQAFKAMADYGKSKGIIVSIETRLVGGGAAAGAARGGAPGAPAAPPPRTDLAAIGLPTWQQNARLIREAGAYANPDVGNTNAMNQQELEQCLSKDLLFPTAGSMHCRVWPTNAQGEKRWDLTAAIKYVRGLGYNGNYNLEGGGGHPDCMPIYEAVMAAL